MKRFFPSAEVGVSIAYDNSGNEKHIAYFMYKNA